MARYKEAAVVVLDVGPHMTNYLPALKRSVFLMAETKLLNHASHEVAVILFGTTETDNEVHHELGPEDEQYLHISTVQPLTCPDMQTLGRINNITAGHGVSDHVSALLVGLDLLKKAIEKRYLKGKKRLLLISTFDTEVEELDSDMRDHVAQELMAKDINLEVFGVGDGGTARSAEAEELRSRNLGGLHELIAQVSGSYHALPQMVDMIAMFPTRETAGTASNQMLKIGSNCNVELQLFKKTSKEKPPSLKLYNTQAAAGGTGEVKPETEYRDSTDAVIKPEEKTKAYKYGQQFVPMDDESVLHYKPGKCMELLGFTDRANVPRWHYMDEAQVAYGKTPGDAQAVSALVHAMVRLDRVAIIRLAKTDKGDITLMVASPMPAPATSLLQQDSLLLNKLPYSDDLRRLFFRNIYADDRPHLLPNDEQKAAMKRLVHTLRLGPAAAMGQSQVGTQAPSQASLGAAGASTQSGAVKEQLVPENTLNPLLQRFYWFFGQRALDPQFQVPPADEDLLAAAVLDQQPLQSLPEAAREVLESLSRVFPLTERDSSAAVAAAAAAAPAPLPAATAGVVAEGEGGVRLVAAVGTEQPVEDFNILLQHGQQDKAISGMQDAITSLVEQSVEDRYFGKACKCTEALRAAAVQHQQPGRFNSFLDRLCDSYRDDAAKRGFWLLLMKSGVGPIHNDEVAGVGVTKAESEEYVRIHGAQQQHAPAPSNTAPSAAEEEDEFADME